MAELCGAKTRSGGKCRKAPINGSKRCKFHGGKSTGPIDLSGNTNAVTHGIYERHLTEQERSDFDHAKLGTVDDELRLQRIRLSRALAAEHKSQNEPELDEVTENEDGGSAVIPRKTSKYKIKDYGSIIDKITARIESLEKTRLTLNSASNAPDADDITRDDTFIAPDEPLPHAPIL